jgi:hypothetical protein
MEATIVNTQAASAAVNAAVNTAQTFDIEKFMQDTGAEVVVSSTSAEQAQQALRCLQNACKHESDAYYELRAQFLSDGSGPAKPVEFESLIGVSIGDIGAELDALSAEYGQYVQELNVAETRSNKFLIGIIGKCHDKYVALLKQSEKEQAKIINRLDAYMLDKAIAVTAKTYALSKILMCVFVGADSKKINSYYSAIKYAQKRGCMMGGFVTLVEECGGLQAMRLANAASKKEAGSAGTVLTRDEKLVQAQQRANNLELAVFESDDLAQNVDATANKIVLIASPLSGGQYAIHAGLTNSSVVDAVLLAFYKEQKESIANEQKAQEQMQEVDEIEQLTAQAAAMAGELVN